MRVTATGGEVHKKTNKKGRTVSLRMSLFNFATLASLSPLLFDQQKTGLRKPLWNAAIALLLKPFHLPPSLRGFKTRISLLSSLLCCHARLQQKNSLLSSAERREMKFGRCIWEFPPSSFFDLNGRGDGGRIYNFLFLCCIWHLSWYGGNLQAEGTGDKPALDVCMESYRFANVLR